MNCAEKKEEIPNLLNDLKAMPQSFKLTLGEATFKAIMRSMAQDSNSETSTNKKERKLHNEARNYNERACS